jgi:alkanesulfonate monooxygenase SsuD/methylene tetrahydromethanopterin reductase-like flavin-dependent oxidoreductase (luciferase family)
VHHFARQLSSPFPLLAAIGARTSRIEIGTAVIDMRYENPLYMAEDAGAADLISGGRLQLGISRGVPEQVIDGFRYFGYAPAEGSDHAAMAREHTRVFLELISGEGFAAQPAADVPESAGPAANRTALAGTSRPDLVGSPIPPHGRVGRRAGPAPDEFDATH